MVRAGEKARAIVYDALGDREIIDEIAGNNRYIAVTDDTVYVGSWFGKGVRMYPLDAISSVNVRKALLTVELEIAMVGSVGAAKTPVGLADRAQNENITMFQKNQYDRVKEIANLILEFRRKPRNVRAQQTHTVQSIPDQIKQLADLRESGVLSDEEFQRKKKELLSRM